MNAVIIAFVVMNYEQTLLLITVDKSSGYWQNEVK